MKKSVIKGGPDLRAAFRISEKGIVSVDIEPYHTGLVWEVTENRGASKMILVLEEWLTAYCARKQPKRLLPLDIALPPYTTKVLLHLQQIPFGTTLSYAELAAETGNPKGARAVGNACGKNPCPLIVPCHRILASNHRLGGFSCGIEIKKILLAFEGVVF